MLTKEEVAKYLKYYKEQHRDEYKLLRLGIFGSVARGESGQNSDLDVVVEFSQPNLFILSGIKEDLQEMFHIEVDVVALSKSMNPKLRKRIERDVVYV